MSTTTADPPARPRFISDRRQAMVEVGLIFLVFFVQAAWPVPGVNETHYLTKAKHYWNPAWCPGDLFLDSRDAHHVFFWTCGWLTRFLSLPATAWCGRLATWLALAWAWRRLSFTLVPRPLLAVLSAALMVAGTTRLHLAGEWLVGGFEAKGIAYVFVLLAMAELARGNWRFVWPLLGVASAFHVLVGGWSVLAAGLAWLAAGHERPGLRETAVSLAIGLALALPGLIPVILLNWGVDPQVVSQANRLYVFTRLPHHLVPQTFAPLMALRDAALIGFWSFLWSFRHVVLVGIWLILCVLVPADAAARRVRWFVAATILLSLIGCLVAWATLGNEAQAASLLRYYWFRMADVLIPAGVALEITRLLAQLELRRAVAAKWCLLVLIVLMGVHLGAVVIERQSDFRPQADSRITNLAAWREICDWAANNTPTGAVFITPRDAQSFHWYAGRSEVVSYKDIPQDAADIVEWWRRVNDIYRQPQVGPDADGFASLAELGRAKLAALGRKYHAGYVITGLYPPLALPRVGPPNRSYVVYRLPDAVESGTPAAEGTSP